MESQGLVAGLGHLIGGAESGSIAQAIGNAMVTGINAKVSLLPMLPALISPTTGGAWWARVDGRQNRL